MAKLTKVAIAEKYGKETKEIEVLAWGGSVDIRKLTIGEKQKAEEILLKDQAISSENSGRVEVSISQAQLSAVMEVSAALVSPKYTVEELLTLPSDAMLGVTEIKKALDEWDTPKKSEAKSSSGD